MVTEGRRKIGQERKILKRHKETFVDDGYVHYLGCGDGFMLQTYVKMYQISQLFTELNIHSYCMSTMLNKADKNNFYKFSYCTVGWFHCLAIINKVVTNIIHHFISKRT